MTIKRTQDFLSDDVDIIIFSISITRFEAQKVKKLLKKKI